MAAGVFALVAMRGRAAQQLCGFVIVLLIFTNEVAVAASSGPQPTEQPESEFDHNSPDSQARRLTVVGTRYQVDAIANLPQQGPSGDRITVHAGVVYPAFTIFATSGLGTSHTLIRAKIAPFDLASTLSTCAQVRAYTESPNPFDGEPGRVQQGAQAGRNIFTNVKFPLAGEWRLCYTADGSVWEELAPRIMVQGSETNISKIWSSYWSMERQACGGSSPPAGCLLEGKVEGYKVHSNSIAQLGTPNPVSPPWKIQLVEMRHSCGGSNNDDPFNLKVSSVTAMPGYQVHSLGTKKSWASRSMACLLLRCVRCGQRSSYWWPGPMFSGGSAGFRPDNRNTGDHQCQDHVWFSRGHRLPDIALQLED